jgi:PAS domain S-box-containing protein
MSKPIILCVDDERNILLILRTQLRQQFPDYRIEIAESAAEALELIEALRLAGVDLPLVIADQIMPGMKGDAFLVALHARHPEILKIMLTGEAGAENLHDVVNRGSLYRFIAKPWNEADLILTVTEALRRYQQEQQLAQQQIALEQASQDLAALSADLKQQMEDRTQDLESALAFNQQVIATAQEGIIVYDQTLRYRVWNRFMENLSGLPAAAVLDQYCLDLFPFLQENGVFALIERALAGETVFAPDAFFNVPSTGKSGWAAERYIPLRDAQGKIVGVLGTVHDITERKQIEIALRESEIQNRTILSALPDITTVISAEGQYLSYYHNQFTGELLPLGNRDLVGMHITEVLPQEAASRCYAAIQRALSTGEMQTYEQPLQFGDRIQYEEVRMLPYQHDCVLCMVRDVSAAKSIETMRQQTEVALQKSAAGLAEAQRIAQVGNWEFDLATQTVSLSEELFRLYGRDSSQWQPTYEEFRQQVHPDDWAPFEQVIQQAIAEGLPYRIEHRILRPDGKLCYALSKGEAVVNAQGQVIKLFGTTQDITAANQAQESFRASERRYATLAEAIPVGIFRLDSAGDCIYVNQYWCEMTGRSAEAAFGKNWIETLHPDDRDRIPAEWAQAFEQGGLYRSEGRYLQPNGTIVWFYCQVLPETDAKGQVTGYVGTVTDISEPKRDEAVRKRAEAQLRESQELLQLTLEFTDICAWRWQPTTGDCEWNGEMEALLELTPGLDNMFQLWCDRMHPEDVDRVQANIQQALDTQTAFAEEYRYYLLDGRLAWRWVKGRGIYTATGDVEQVLGKILISANKPK